MLRKLVRPFLLKVHPDVSLTATAKEINLKAIQNLNHYIDIVEDMQRGRSPKSDRVVEIDFTLKVPRPLGEIKKRESTHFFRRKVELSLPREPHNVVMEASRQIRKLLRVAGLPIPKVEGDDGEEATVNHPHKSGSPLRHQHHSPYDASRDAFMSRLNHEKLDQVFREAVRGMNADLATQGMVRDSRELRRKLIAQLLSRTRIQDDSIKPMEQMLAFRRLSLLLDHNFDKLHLEDLGSMWERTYLVLRSSRKGPYASSSAVHKHNRQSGENGFCFILHSDDSVTMEFPVDFQDDELVAEFSRNIWDYYVLMGDGMDEIFGDEAVAANDASL